MKRSKKLIAVIILAFLSVYMQGCLIEIKKYEGDPEVLFADIQIEMKALARAEALKNRRPADIHLMVYEKNSGDLVRIRVPFWLLEKFDDENEVLNLAGKLKERRWADRRKIDLSLGDLKNMGPGTLLQVNDEDCRLLLWLR